MKNIKFLSSLFAGLLLFTACETDMESNPTLSVPDSFVLNTPTLSEGVYNLDNSDHIEFTCTQPDYGYTAPVVYTVEVSLSEDFTTLETLTTSYTTAKMEVAASEMAVSVTNLKVAEDMTDADFPMTTSVYVRLKADLSNVDATVYSNPVEIDVYLSFSLPATEFPEEMYVVGSICDWDWESAYSMVPVYGSSDYDYCGTFWSMIYFDADAQMKVNTVTSWSGTEVGYEGATIIDNAGASVSDSDGNIKVANAGWYIVTVKTEIVGLDLVYTITFDEPKVYLYGATVGDVWEANDANLFTVPADGAGDFVSPAFSAGGEIRACVVLDGFDWWKSEFIVLSGALEYRANGPDQDRVEGSAGQKLYINFPNATGKVE